MYILAFETSCDDTSVALMKDGELIAMSTRTQLEHDSTGGVVPEVAARSHANAIFPCIYDVLKQSQIQLADIDYIACTEKPGLLPSLLTGLTVAKTLSLTLSVPLILVDHIESHIFANFLGRSYADIQFPAVVLTVSGGHTEIYLWKSLFELDIIGQTRDDAAGECFDKVAKMMGLGFPGGAKIAKLAEEYRSLHDDDFLSQKSRIFPLVLLEKDSLDFSFSGLKTAVKREIDMRSDTSENNNGNSKYLSEEDIREISYEVEEIIALILSKKLVRALEFTGAKMMCLAGGVSANTLLKKKLLAYAEEQSIPFHAPIKNLYSMDNAAMVGIRAFYEIRRNSV
ncbi:MAG: tRNA (adenosine(37)-N6)-threonylcarbamoyltransferase complex transferase subunit TsaD [Candidatus Altimarinota bacterium]